jgi:hypothetical protein
MKQFTSKPDSLLIGITEQLQLCRLLHTIKTQNFAHYGNRKKAEGKQLHNVWRYLCVKTEIGDGTILCVALFELEITVWRNGEYQVTKIFGIVWEEITGDWR